MQRFDNDDDDTLRFTAPGDTNPCVAAGGEWDICGLDWIEMGRGFPGCIFLVMGLAFGKLLKNGDRATGSS